MGDVQWRISCIPIEIADLESVVPAIPCYNL